jgi:hypothetical protein
MAAANNAAEQVERYLLRLRLALADTPEREKQDILAELRSHIVDRLADTSALPEQIVEQTLAGLGDPETLAASYQSRGLMRRAASTFSPALILRATLRWAMTGVRGFGVLMVLLIGYLLSFSFYVLAFAKPFFPDRVGLWMEPGDLSTLHMGMELYAPPPQHELLGPWFVLVSLLLGSLCLIATIHFVRRLIRKYGGLGKAIAH